MIHKKIKTALIISKTLLDNKMDNVNDLNEEDADALKHFIEAIKVGCQCDDYNGYHCGCTNRISIANEALEELEKL